MQITLTNIGKRFNREWIFRNLSYTFISSKKYAITGANGSGKSTLLQVIAGAVGNSEGNIQYSINSPDSYRDQCSNEEHYQHIAVAAPYLELIEEMTANELLDFHTSFKPLSISKKEALEIVGLEKAAGKQLRYYSSGMKQRLKLAQAFFSSTPVLMLDEPTTNLDAEGIKLYHHLINTYAAGRLLIISSNDKEEYGFCDEVLSIGDYK